MIVSVVDEEHKKLTVNILFGGQIRRSVGCSSRTAPPCSDNYVVIYNGLAQIFVYTCYLDVGTIYNRNYINCTSARLPQSPSTSRSPVDPASRISIKATVKNLTF